MIGHVFLNRYEVTRLLGTGGMGKVFLARQIDLNRHVVIKVMNDNIAADRSFRDRFERETLLMAKFQHPFVVTLLDASLNDPSGPCIVMEYVRGMNLDQLLQRNKRLPAPRAGRLIGQLCEALQAAHAESIIHRDLKPSNIMVVDADTPRERIKVMDFGLAKMLGDQLGPRKHTDTSLDLAVGTPAYISPEQARGEGVDHRSDIYSVGVIAYEMLAGKLPFTGATIMDVVHSHLHDEPPKFRELGVEVPATIESLVLSCMEKDPHERPQTATQLHDRLQEALNWIAQEQARALLATRPGGDSETPLLPAFADMAIAPEDDPLAIEFHLEAWMPKRVALLKLRGFVEDNEGEVLESAPGLVRVRFKPPVVAAKHQGKLKWLGLGRRQSSMLIDLRMTSSTGRRNVLQIKARFRTENTKLAQDPGWKRACTRRFVDLRGYLISPKDGE